VLLILAFGLYKPKAKIKSTYLGAFMAYKPKAKKMCLFQKTEQFTEPYHKINLAILILHPCQGSKVQHAHDIMRLYRTNVPRECPIATPQPKLGLFCGGPNNLYLLFIFAK
jgi:hypothetical protein